MEYESDDHDDSAFTSFREANRSAIQSFASDQSLVSAIQQRIESLQNDISSMQRQL